MNNLGELAAICTPRYNIFRAVSFQSSRRARAKWHLHFWHRASGSAIFSIYIVVVTLIAGAMHTLNVFLWLLSRINEITTSRQITRRAPENDGVHIRRRFRQIPNGLNIFLHGNCAPFFVDTSHCERHNENRSDTITWIILRVKSVMQKCPLIIATYRTYTKCWCNWTETAYVCGKSFIFHSFIELILYILPVL